MKKRPSNENKMTSRWMRYSIIILMMHIIGASQHCTPEFWTVDWRSVTMRKITRMIHRNYGRNKMLYVKKYWIKIANCSKTNCVTIDSMSDGMHCDWNFRDISSCNFKNKFFFFFFSLFFQKTFIYLFFFNKIKFFMHKNFIFFFCLFVVRRWTMYNIAVSTTAYEI